MHSATKETTNSRLQHVRTDRPPVYPDPLRMELAFLWKEHRVVTATGTISVQGNQFEVDPGLARCKVTIRFDPQ